MGRTVETPTGRTVLYDLAALAEDRLGEWRTGFRWPTPYEAYAFLSRDLVADLVEAARTAAVTPRLEAVLEATLYDLVTDLGHIARIAVDLHHLRRSGAEPVYDAEASPILRFFREEGTEAVAVVAHRTWLWHHRARPTPAVAAKRILRRAEARLGTALTPSARRFDLLSHNPLLDEFLEREAVLHIDLFPNSHDWSDGSRPWPATEEARAALVDACLARVVPRLAGDPCLTAPLRRLAGAVTAFHLNKAWEDLDRIERMRPTRRMGAVLAGGTPKHLGRLLSWHYRREGRKVYRFAHGGERAFYDDYPWALAELPFCDRYYGHSRAEAENIARRRAEGRTARAGPAELLCESLGSRRHQRIRESAPRRPAGKRTGLVMYVAGGYLGESAGDFPSRKPPDPLYFDWQLSLLAALRDVGYRVITKLHPKGILREAALLAPFSDGVERGRFDPNRYAVDCYVFDFAGTAFIDALASNTGVVLVDMGVRPFDGRALPELAARSPLVPCRLDERNRFRADSGALRAALERASEMRECPEGFYRRYFF